MRRRIHAALLAPLKCRTAVVLYFTPALGEIEVPIGNFRTNMENSNIFYVSCNTSTLLHGLAQGQPPYSKHESALPRIFVNSAQNQSMPQHRCRVVHDVDGHQCHTTKSDICLQTCRTVCAVCTTTHLTTVVATSSRTSRDCLTSNIAFRSTIGLTWIGNPRRAARMYRVAARFAT